MTVPNADDLDEKTAQELQKIIESLESSRNEELGEIKKRLGSIEESLRSGKHGGASLPAVIDSGRGASRSMVIISIVAAIILGIAVFVFIQGIQWRSALAEMRAEPGIQVVSVRWVGPLKRQITGLRDPLAPNPRSILHKHNIISDQVDLNFTEYHSLNTPYARIREEKNAEDMSKLRDKLISVVGRFSEESRAERENELGKVSQLLLEVRFPEAMRKLNLQYTDGVWHADGQLLANEYADFKAQAQKYILHGTVDLDNLQNYTEARTRVLKEGIETIDLLKKDYEGKPAHLPRLARLIREYDSLCKRSGLPVGRLRLILESREPASVDEDFINRVASRLTDEARLAGNRIRIVPPVRISGEDAEERLSIEIAE